MLQLKDTCVYLVKYDDDIVYIGTTDDMCDARQYHKENDQKFTDVVAVTDDMTCDQAKQIASELISDYINANQGQIPRYNQ